MTAAENLAALLRAILAQPDEDTPRLIYADALQERGEEGDEIRAEFIRVQCELGEHQGLYDTPASNWTIDQMKEHGKCNSLRRRQRKLLEQWETKWLTTVSEATSAVIAFGCDFSRGFVHSITCTAADWLKHADTILKHHPVREVTLTTDPEPFIHNRRIEWYVAYMHRAHVFAEVAGECVGVIASEGASFNTLLLEARWKGVRFHIPTT